MSADPRRATAVLVLAVAAAVGSLGLTRAWEPAGAQPTSGSLGLQDGELPDDVSVVDTRYPAVSGLDPELLAALREAASDAASDGVEIDVNSGWRSVAYQQHLLDRAVDEYGSTTAAARWVATPDTSAHVSGDAVDVAPVVAAGWLSRHGAAFGLCQVYANEAWHYELRPDAVTHGCPPMYADPGEDPRAAG